MNIVQPKLLEDLEIDKKIIPSIDKTITMFGQAKFRELFNIMYYGEQNLMRRREIIQSIIQNTTSKKKITRSLNKIKTYQDDIGWLFTPVGKEFKELYCTNEMFNTRDILSVKNFLKTYTPSLIVIVYFLIYLVFRYYGVSINLKDYFYGIYLGYKIFIESMLSLVSGNEYMISFATNFLATLYVFYQIYSIYNSFDSSISHYYKCSDFKSKFRNISHVLDEINLIYNNDKFMTREKQLIKSSLDNVNDFFANKINKLGDSLILKKTAESIEKDMNSILQYVGLIDAFINISKLVTVKGYVFPNFVFGQQKPYLMSEGLWCPYINKHEQITNDCQLGTPNNMIITGPNTSGKSTYIRMAMLSVLLSQTIGVTCCTNILFTPFKYLFTYLDIPNIVRNKESLFEAEILRCMEYCNILAGLGTDEFGNREFSFTVIDELFTGTNPKEGIASSYAVCEHIGKFDNSLNIITTHFMELTKLGDDLPNVFKNMKFYVIKNEDGSFDRPYVIKEGKSEQHIAIALLKNKGYNDDIVNRALDKLKDL